MSRLFSRIQGRVFGWFDSKEARLVTKPMPASFSRKARLALQNLEDRVVPASFVVTNTADSGTGSLRAAITLANSTVGGDTITFNTNPANGTDFSAGVNGIALLTALPVCSATAGEHLKITGPGADKLVIFRGVTGALVRPFSFGGPNTFELTDMTITGFSGSSVGGAVFFNTGTTAASTLTLNRVNLTGNTTGAGFPGGAGYFGSGTYNILNCTVSGNTSATTTGGGGFRWVGTVATNVVNIDNTTISNNTVTGSGGNGGGISFTTFVGTVNIRNSTIVNNSCAGGTTAAGTGGGGINRNTTTAFTLNMSSSIVANNTSANATDIALGGTLNVVANTDSVTGVIRLNTTNSGSATDPRLSIAGFHNGGPTPVRVPLRAAPTSAAIDKQTTGTPPGGANDQTGSARGALPNDAGAVESTAGAPFAMAQPLVNVLPTSPLTSYTVTMNYYDDTNIKASTIGPEDVKLQLADGTLVSADSGTPDSGSDGPMRIGTYVFTPPGGTWDGNETGFVRVLMQANQVKNTADVAIDTTGGKDFEGAFLVLLPTPTAAVFSAPPVTSGGDTKYSFSITYTDIAGGVGISEASYQDSQDIRVTGPNGFDVTATFDAADQTGDGTPRIVTYYFTPPGGSWDTVDNGSYTLTMKSKQVSNTVGTFVLPGVLGSFTVAAPQPTGVLTAPIATINTTGVADVAFDVQYDDIPGGPGLKYLTLNDGNEVLVTGPNGFSQTAGFVTINDPSDGTPRIVSYTLDAPGADWDYTENGTYTLTLQANSIKNLANLGNGQAVLGTFNVSLPGIYTVTNTNDSGTGSLRAALALANANALADVIVFSDGTGGTTDFTVPQTIQLDTGLSITNPVTITGKGSALTTITAAAGKTIGIFNTASAAANAIVNVSGLRVTGGNISTDGGAFSIGDENVTLTNMLLEGNTAGDDGAGIYVLGAATLAIANSVINNNVGTGTSSLGAAIFTDVAATLTIDASTLSGNTANGTSFGGGALYLTGGSTTITNSTLSGNSVGGTNGGGALYAWSTPTAVIISNSTLAENTAKQGGAIRINSGPLTLRNSTIVGNSALTAATSGGGISFISSGLITIESTVIAGNSAAGSPNDIHAGGTNVVDANNSAWSQNYTPNGSNIANLINQSFASMAIGSLTKANGGPTATMALGPTSVLLHKGSNSQAYTTDQRGGSNKRESPSTFPDIGAYELQTTAPIAFVGTLDPVTDDQPGINNPYTFTITYADNANMSLATIGNQPDDDIQIVKVGGGFTTTATFVSADQGTDAPVIKATYSFVPPGGFWNADDNGDFQINMLANTVKNDANVAVPAGTLGSFTVTFPAPTGTLTAPIAKVETTGVTAVTFDVLYDDVVGGPGLKYLTLNDGNEVLVTGPNSFSQVASFVTIDNASDGTPRTVSYTLDAPGTDWDFTENGIYTLTLQSNKIQNLDSYGNATTVLGTFEVALPGIFTVTNTNDSGAGSLRAALALANANALPDVIVFSDGTGGTTDFTQAQTIQLDTGLSISNPVTITGKGSALTTITAAAGKTIGIFNTASAAASAAISVSGLRVTGGNISTDGGAFSIGDEAVTLTDMTLENNTATDDGGAIYVLGAANLTITHSTIQNNLASSTSSYGGAIFTDVACTLTIEYSTVSGNTANGSSFGGGAMYLTGGNIAIRNSTLSGNSSAATNGGGALYTWSTPTSFVISNSTLINNTAKQGGAIRIQSGPLTLRNSTIINNSATTAATSGGGISFISTGLITIESTVIAGNSALGVANDIHAGGTNTVNANNSAWSTNYVPNGTNTDNLNNQNFASMEFGSLTNANGGPTATVAIGATSSLLNKGSDSQALGTDQRGTGFNRQRPSGFPDIGAYERVPDGPISKVGTLSNVFSDQVGVNNPYTFTVTYADDANMSLATIGNQPDDDIQIVRVGGGFTATATFVSADQGADAPVINATYSFVPPGGSWDGPDAGVYQINVLANTVKNETNVAVPAGTLGSFSAIFPTSYVVTNTNDSGTGSLRQAILDANANAPANDTIVFESTTFSNPQTIALTSAAISITDGVTIVGPGKNLLTLSGSNARQIFLINNNVAGTAIDVEIRDATLTNATVTGSGGAVLIQDENVTFTRTIFTGNRASISGGAISVTLPDNNFLTIQDSLLTLNTAGTDGGAIQAFNPTASKELSLTIRGTTISNNTSNDDGGGVNLGAASNTATYNLLMENSTLSGNVTGLNSTTPDGGGMYFRGAVGSTGFNIRNSTISGNSSHTGTSATTFSVRAGGLAFPFVNGTIFIQNSTITNNTSAADISPTVLGQGGGGIAINRPTASSPPALLVLESTVVAGNSSFSGKPDISSEDAVEMNYSAVGDPNGFTPTGTSGTVGPNVAFGTDLKLGKLLNNGGSTLTHAILPGSPLIDAGINNVVGQLYDQRGVGFDRKVGTAVDIGAFERVPGIPFAYVGALPAVTSDLPGTNNPYTFTVTYSDDTNIEFDTVGNQPNDDIQIVRVGGGFTTTAIFVSADVGNDAPNITATYKFTPPGGIWEGNDNGTYEVNLLANTVKNTANTAVAAMTLGAITVNAPAPAATASGATVYLDDATTNPYQFTVTFTDANAISVGTIINNNNAVRVTGPNGFDVAATYISIDDNTDGTPRTATYQITPPDNTVTDTWDTSDNGTYSIVVQGSQVKNTTDTYVPFGTAGTFLAFVGGVYVVTTNADSGAGSLREAIGLANADTTPDTIAFSSLFNTPQTITLTTGELLISQPLTILGTGANKLTVSGNNASRVFNVNNASSVIDVTLKGMTITGGHTTGTGAANGGAGASVGAERVTFDGVYVTGNSSGGPGGGISAGASGNNLTILNSTVSGNTTTGGTSSYGGGVYFTLTSNVIIRNSTISSNSTSNAFGGGIGGYAVTTTSTVVIENTTVTLNDAGTGVGGGLRMFSTNFTVVNSIFSGNLSPSAPDIGGGAAPVATYSAFGSTTGFSFGAGSGNNLIGATLNLGSLQDNGGPTPTIALGTGSDAINAGSPTNTQTYDQRGLGYQRVVGGASDIGAFEVQGGAAPVVSNFLVNQGYGATYATQRSRLINIVVNFASPVDAAQFQALGAVTLTSTGGPSNGNVVNTGNGLIVSPASGSVSSITLTFANVSTPGFIDNASLADGYWRLAIPGASYTSTLNDPTLRRLFGDFDNNGTVEGAIDFPAFGNDFNATVALPGSPFDFNNDGIVEGSIDFPAFGNNFNVTL